MVSGAGCEECGDAHTAGPSMRTPGNVRGPPIVRRGSAVLRVRSPQKSELDKSTRERAMRPEDETAPARLLR